MNVLLSDLRVARRVRDKYGEITVSLDCGITAAAVAVRVRASTVDS
jgi:hypothetical protein